tara:strand:- start:6667 stop:6894 length:228 start_codon:yes stop_codon:yes gene_type:complete
VWFFGAMTSHLENIEYYKTRTEMYRVIGQEYVDNYEEQSTTPHDMIMREATSVRTESVPSVDDSFWNGIMWADSD